MVLYKVHGTQLQNKSPAHVTSLYSFSCMSIVTFLLLVFCSSQCILFLFLIRLD